MGISVADQSGKMLKFQDIMVNLGNRLGDLPEQSRLQILKELFGKIGIAGGAALQKFAKTGELKKFAKALKNSGTAAEDMARIMNQGASGGLKKLQSAAEGLAIEIGDSGLLKDFTDVIKKITEFVSEISKSSPEAFKLGVNIALVTAVIGPVILGFGGLIALFPSFILGLGSIKLAMIALNVSMVANPVGAVIIGVTALVAVFIILFSDLELLELGFKRVWKNISEVTSDFIDGVKQGISDFVDFSGRKFTQFFDFISSMVGKIEDAIPDFIKTSLGFDVSQVKDQVAKLDVIPKIKKDQQKETAQNRRALRTVPAFGDEKKSRIFQKTKAEVKKQQKSLITVDFKNAPKGTVVNKTKQDDEMLLDIKTGLQGAGAL